MWSCLSSILQWSWRRRLVNSQIQHWRFNVMNNHPWVENMRFVYSVGRSVVYRGWVWGLVTKSCIFLAFISPWRSSASVNWRANGVLRGYRDLPLGMRVDDKQFPSVRKVCVGSWVDQEVSDPLITDVRSTYDKAWPVISERRHFNGMAHSHQIFNQLTRWRLCTVIGNKW